MADSEITGMDHASIIVQNTARALEFYSDILGLKLDDSRPDLGYAGAWLQVGGSQIHLLELPNPDPSRRSPSSMEGVTAILRSGYPGWR